MLILLQSPVEGLLWPYGHFFNVQTPEQFLHLRSWLIFSHFQTQCCFLYVIYFSLLHYCLQYMECVQLTPSFYVSSTLVLFSAEPVLKLWTVVIHNISFVTLAVRDVIEYLWYGQTIVFEQGLSALYTSGLIVGSLWLIYFVCHAGKLDSLFPDDSYIDMGEIDVGRKVTQQIPPGVFWRSQVFIDHPMYLKFNVSLSKDALVGIYGRRGLPPSHTQVGKTWMSLFIFSVISCVFPPLSAFFNFKK